MFIILVAVKRKTVQTKPNADLVVNRNVLCVCGVCAYLHSYDNTVVSGSEAGTVLKAKVSGLKTQLLAQLCFLLFCQGNNNHNSKMSWYYGRHPISVFFFT